MSNKIGRNYLCPCGSGKKYKHCCLIHDQQSNQVSDNNFIPGFHETLSNQEFSSLEEAQAFMNGFTQKQNQAPQADFHGLSSEQMHRLLNFTFESPEVIFFSEQFTNNIKAPMFTLFYMLVEHISEKGLKPTAKGNLPRNLCREIALHYLGEEKYQEQIRFGQINKEEDYFDLHVVRLVAELSGLIRKYKGKFILSKKCKNLLTKEDNKQLFLLLLKAYITKFNWGYWDRYEELNFIQQSFAFTLYLLKQYGEDRLSSEFYADQFLKAFPALLQEVTHTPYFEPEDELKRCYTLRVLKRFTGFLGLAQVEPVGDDELLVKEYSIQKLPLLDELVRFPKGTKH